MAVECFYNQSLEFSLITVNITTNFSNNTVIQKFPYKMNILPMQDHQSYLDARKRYA